MSHEYDFIATAYRDSKRLPWRKYIEEYTLFETLGDMRGRQVVDLACGEGFYTRKLRQAGAAHVTGVDISGEMIRLAEEEERVRPLGCAYLHQDVADLELEAVEVVVAMYLLNYAKTGGELLRFCEAASRVLRPGGRFVGFNDNMRLPPAETDSWAKYGFERSCAHPPAEGDAIEYRFTNEDGRQFAFRNFFLTPETYRAAFHQAGFADFQWVGPYLHPSQRDDPFWDAFMAKPPVTGFTAAKA